MERGLLGARTGSAPSLGRIVITDGNRLRQGNLGPLTTARCVLTWVTCERARGNLSPMDPPVHRSPPATRPPAIRERYPPGPRGFPNSTRRCSLLRISAPPGAEQAENTTEEARIERANGLEIMDIRAEASTAPHDGASTTAGQVPSHRFGADGERRLGLMQPQPAWGLGWRRGYARPMNSSRSVLSSAKP